ncbi:MAG TPA: L,D-transpeptidase [Candidatus Gracilibacteria bacterium]|nr:L,D-transpeptidase [Candidatus Gracilibacteria bacterium]
MKKYKPKTKMKKLLLKGITLSLFATFLIPASVQAQGLTPSCDYTKPEKEQHKAAFIAVRKPGVVEKGELFETKVYIRNMGNTPWFSVASGCAGPHVSLGTDKDRDRSSSFYPGAAFADSGWAASNRITMTSDRVDPGYLAEFVFQSRAPQEDGYFREVYTPVVEGLGWLDASLFTSDIRVGNGNIPIENKDLLQYIKVSANLSNYDLEGEKWIQVDISEQKMKLHVGDYVVREFPVSTGKSSTPTPVGTTHIFQKQEVRVGAAWPHYIMPKWMYFRAGGYGIHALPSLGNDGGIFWTEALNHIGSARSHGCIRLLPQDATFAYDFAPIGTKVVVQY